MHAAMRAILSVAESIGEAQATHNQGGCGILAMNGSVIVWHPETVPDHRGAAAGNGLAGKADEEVREAAGDKSFDAAQRRAHQPRREAHHQVGRTLGSRSAAKPASFW
jgi:hypothetical protein